MKVFLFYEDNENSDLHKTLKITLPKSWKTGPASKVLGCFVESYNDNEKHASNPLDQEQMHLAIREEGGESGSGGDESSPSLIPIASDAITIETIPDRANVYILHGPSKTMEEMAAEKQEALERERAEKANTVACQHLGCKTRFPKGGPYPECSYHKSPPVFHETAKWWSCCPNKKAYDWEEFQAIPGCCSGVCTEVKESEQKQFLGGCDLREDAGGGAQLKSIDDFNKAQESGSDAAPVLERLRHVLAEIDVENELYDQVVEGIKKEMEGDDTPLDAVAAELGKKLKTSMKSIAAEQLRIK